MRSAGAGSDKCIGVTSPAANCGSSPRPPVIQNEWPGTLTARQCWTDSDDPESLRGEVMNGNPMSDTFG